MSIARIAYLASAAALAVAAVPATATVITFDNFNTDGLFGGNGLPITTYTESGFTFTAPAGQYAQSVYDPAYAPYYNNNALLTGYYNTTQLALLTLIGPGTFTFTSFDASVQVISASYTVTGYLGLAQVFSSSGTVGVTSPSTYSTYGGFSSAIVDRVTIATNADYQLYIDNVTTGIAATPAVPEPASWAMMIAGMGAIGGMMRRRQRITVRFA